MIDEAERSLHDALCVIRSLVKRRYLLAGGGAPEVEVAMRLEQLADTLTGKESFCVRAFAAALDVIPTTLAENAGHNPISVLTELRARHRQGERFAGVTAKKGVANMWEENVVQPLLVTSSTMQLATECVRMILKIDDIVREFSCCPTFAALMKNVAYMRMMILSCCLPPEQCCFILMF